jgi:hypothetical protein
MIRRKGKKLKEPKEENQKEPIFYLKQNGKKLKEQKKKERKKMTNNKKKNLTLKSFSESRTRLVDV